MISFNASMKAVANEILQELCGVAKVDPEKYDIVIKVIRKSDARLVDFDMSKWAKDEGVTK